MKQLKWKPLADEIEGKLSKFFSKPYYDDKYVAILLLGDDPASVTYDRMKKQFANQIWLDAYIFGNNPFRSGIDNSIFEFNKSDYEDLKDVLAVINYLNDDPKCIWIMVQLPLPDCLAGHEDNILSSIDANKDFDGISWKLLGLSALGKIDFTTATSQACLNMLEYYDLDDYEGRNITIIGQSNLVWKPLAMELMKRQASVYCFNEYSDQEVLKNISQNSKYILSATGVLELVDSSFIGPDGDQIVLDIWWWKKNWKPTGDVDFDDVRDKVGAISPVPGGVWPVTVASLFENLMKLEKYKMQGII